MSACGRTCFSAPRTPLRSRVTAMSKPAIWRPRHRRRRRWSGRSRRRSCRRGAPSARPRWRLGIGHQHVLGVARQVDHHRLADAERDEAQRRVAVAPATWAPACGGSPADGVARQAPRAEQRSEQRGRNRICSPWPGHPHFAVDVVVTPKRTMLTPRRLFDRLVRLGLGGALASTRLRRASESVPSWRDSASVSAWRGAARALRSCRPRRAGRSSPRPSGRSPARARCCRMVSLV